MVAAVHCHKLTANLFVRIATEGEAKKTHLIRKQIQRNLYMHIKRLHTGATFSLISYPHHSGAGILYRKKK